MKCPWCSRTYKRMRVTQHYCSTACSKAADQLELKRARAIYRALYWAANAPKRDPDRGMDMTFLMREAREWKREDQAAGREAPPRHDHMAERGHQRRLSAAIAFRNQRIAASTPDC